MTLIKRSAKFTLKPLDAIIVTIAIVLLAIAFAANKSPIKNIFEITIPIVTTHVTETN